MDYIDITIKRIGSATVTVTVNPGTTAEEVLTSQNINTKGSEIRFNGVKIEPQSALNNSGELFISKAIAGAK